jgi:IMP dehydrogenase
LKTLFAMLSPAEKFLPEGLTYDDVLVVPAFSQILPYQTNLRTQLTRNITINVPIISAAMDTVTEAELAIAMAREGGIGIIHKNMTIAQQADQVRKVKRSESGMIQDPITLLDNAIVADALKIMKENRIGGIPIINTEGKLVGILTNRDLRFEKDVNRPVAKVMTRENLITAEENIDMQKAEAILQEFKIEKLPVVTRDGQLRGLITFKDIEKIKSHPNACKDNLGRLRAGAAVGVTYDIEERVDALMKAGADVITVDTAHGHSKGVLETVRRVKNTFPNMEIIAGNVATGEGAKALADAGADCVKVGVGPGSICTTRVIAGIGMPQLTAVLECARALEGSGIPVIADGGIRYTGDIVKAIVAGASTIMAGSIFAGVEEAPGETIIYEGRKFKTYRGMGSVEAMKQGSGDRYFQDPEDEIKKLVPEGIVGRVPYKGKLSEVIYQYIGGLRAGMGYAGAATISDLQKARFIRITSSGIRESHPHDVVVTKEAPNYSPA